MKMRKRLRWLAAALLVLLAVFLVYGSVYYRAGQTAQIAMESDETVRISAADYGWLFDGPSEEDVLIFYPGGKVEETAYASLLHQLAAEGLDVCLVRMPLHLAVLNMNAADEIIERTHYANYYIGGHSLGGAVAANYASKNGDQLAGVVLCAAYATHPLDDRLKMITLYGTEDHVLNMQKLSEETQYLPPNAVTYIIRGGNHAQFGDYGIQSGDGLAGIPASEQQSQAVQAILNTTICSEFSS